MTIIFSVVTRVQNWKSSPKRRWSRWRRQLSCHISSRWQGLDIWGCKLTVVFFLSLKVNIYFKLFLFCVFLLMVMNEHIFFRHTVWPSCHLIVLFNICGRWMNRIKGSSCAIRQSVGRLARIRPSGLCHARRLIGGSSPSVQTRHTAIRNPIYTATVMVWQACRGGSKTDSFRIMLEPTSKCAGTRACVRLHACTLRGRKRRKTWPFYTELLSNKRGVRCKSSSHTFLLCTFLPTCACYSNCCCHFLAGLNC